MAVTGVHARGRHQPRGPAAPARRGRGAGLRSTRSPPRSAPPPRPSWGTLPHADGFQALPGLGARGIVDGQEVIAGRDKLFVTAGSRSRRSWPGRAPRGSSAGRTVVLAGWDGQARGAVAVADTVKPSAAAAVAGLRGLGLRTVLLTGDSQATAEAVAAQIGTDEVIAGALPGHKVAVIQGPAGPGPPGGHGRGRGQRRARAGRRRPRAGPRHGHRRGDQRRGPDRAPRRPRASSRTRSGWPAPPWPPSGATWPGRSATTSPRSRSPPPGSSTR